MAGSAEQAEAQLNPAERPPRPAGGVETPQAAPTAGSRHGLLQEGNLGAFSPRPPRWPAPPRARVICILDSQLHALTPQAPALAGSL